MKRHLLTSTSPLVLTLPLVAGLSMAGAAQAQVVIAPGTTVTIPVTLTGSQTLAVEAGGGLQTAATSITQSGATAGVLIGNAGTIRSTTGRAFDTSGSPTTRTITITNGVGGLIQADANDAIRVNTNITSGTVAITNAGTILAAAPTNTSSTVQGQALDLRTMNSAGVTLSITNLAGGIIRATNDDALRPGLNATIDNAGLIESFGANTSGGDNGTSDAIDVGGRDGVRITNRNGGGISGARHGVTADAGTYTYITNVTGGTITGRNGSGVGLDGSGFVLNSGIITGAYAGAGNIFNSSGVASLNGDGDGVDIDGLATIDNAGTIQGLGAGGVDSGGRTNGADGIAAGGGLFINRAGATIAGDKGILIDDGAGGSGAGATILHNAGTITGRTTGAVTLVGTFDDSIVNSGTISGVGSAIDMGAGNDSLTIVGGTISGNVTGGAGTDSLVFSLLARIQSPNAPTATPADYSAAITHAANGRFTVNSAITGFENVSILAGTVTLANGGSVDQTVNISGQAGLTVDQGSNLRTSGTSINWNDATTGDGVIITNAGTIRSTAGRAIDSSGAAATLRSRVLTINNQAGGLIQADTNDAIRVNSNIDGSVRIVNAGTILAAAPTNTSSTVQGQALDLRTMNSAGSTLSITNLAGGIIRAMNDDALRPGLNATIDNAGLIESFGANTSGGDNGTSDAIDAGARTGVVVTNNNGGVISGARHGITADTDISVINRAGGTITGRNGSGVGSDGNGTVVNYGLISGDYAGAGNIFNSSGVASLNGDGDGVDIDQIANITNFGTIRGTGAGGVDSGGLPNNSEGIAAGGGVIDNRAGGLIQGATRGILIDNGSSGSAYAASTITNAGTIIGQSGAAITLIGAYNDQVTNAGTITGGGTGGGTGPVAVSLGDGNDTLTLVTGSATNGRVDGGTGSDALVLAGTGVGTLNLTATPVAGFESLVKQDAGTWILSGASAAFSGGVRIDNGALSLSVADFTGPVSIGAGGMLRGIGRIGGPLTVAGTLAPGSSPGTMTVAGTVTMTATSLFSVDVNGSGTGSGAGNYSRLLVTGAGNGFVANGTITPVLAGITTCNPACPTYTPGLGESFRIVQAEGGVTGTFSSLVQPSGGLAAGTRFEVRYDTNAVDLRVTPANFTDLSLLGVSQNGNQRRIGAAMEALRQSGTAARVGSEQQLVLDALYSPTSGGAVASLQDDLAGGIYADMQRSALENRRRYADTLSARLSRAGGAAGTTQAWVSGFGATVGQRSDEEARGFDSRSAGMLAGIDLHPADGATIGVAAGYGYSRVTSDNGSGKADQYASQFALYGRVGSVGWFADAQLGAGQTRNEVERALTAGSLARTAKGEGKDWDMGATGRVGYRIENAAFRFEPSLALGYHKISTEDVSESGAQTLGLQVGASDLKSLQLRLGGLLEKDLLDEAGAVWGQVNVQAGLRRELKDEDAVVAVAFQGAPAVVAQIRAADPGRTGLDLGVGFQAALAPDLAFYASYDLVAYSNAINNNLTAGLRYSW